MIKRATIENYQSIKKAELELAPLTVVVGESNKGKSALLRALRALAFNESGNAFIHSGESFAAVDVELDNGQHIAWMKGKTGRYVVDEGTEGERVFTKLGQSVPEEIQGLLGIRTIEVDSTKLTPQVSDQFDPPFLLRESAGKAARILAKMTQLDVVVTAAAECNKDLKRLKQKYADTQELIAERERLLEGFSGIAEQESELLLRENDYKLLCENWGLVEDARGKLAALKKAEAAARPLPVSSEQIHGLVGRVALALEAQRYMRKLVRAEDILEEAALQCDLDEVDHVRAGASHAIVALNKLAKLDKAEGVLATCDDARARLRQSLEAVETNIEAYGPCPTCGQLTVSA